MEAAGVLPVVRELGSLGVLALFLLLILPKFLDQWRRDFTSEIGHVRVELTHLREALVAAAKRKDL